MRAALSGILAIAMMLFTFTTTVQAGSDNPIFGGAKVSAMNKADSEKVTGKGGYTALYGYYGNLYLSNAVYYAGLGQYYNYFGYNSTAGSYYYSAYSNASTAATYYYYAYAYQNY